MSDVREILDELTRHLEWQRADLEARSEARIHTRYLWQEPVAKPARAPVAPQPTQPARAPVPAQPTRAPVAAQPLSAASAAPNPQAPRSGEVRSLRELPKPTAVPEADRRALSEIRVELGDCRRCKLCEGRRNIVFGAGNPKAELVFVGEGPGAEEDEQGVPFVGAAGQLLTKMIEAMGFTRDQVYICNVVKCRPPGNRNPELEEIQACEPFLRAQLGALSPKVIVALGKFAAQTLLRDETAITRMRGNWREYCGVPLMPTFHPAYLLRNPAEKTNAWSDLRQVMQKLGKEPAKRGA